MNLLVQKKIQELNVIGISFETIRRAKWNVRSFIERKGTFTNKQLRSLFPAALLSLPENRVTERQLEKIFGITRKTIRKWKELLQKDLTPNN